MTMRVAFVFSLGREIEAGDGDDGGCGVGEVVEGVCERGDAVAENSNNEFSGKKNEVDK